jgi:hypothetical protein
VRFAIAFQIFQSVFEFDAMRFEEAVYLQGGLKPEHLAELGR